MATHQHRGRNDESRVYRVGLHPMSLAGGATGAAVTLVLAALIVRHNHLGPAMDRWVMVGGVGLACLWLVGPVARYFGFEVLLGGEEIRVRPGPFGAARSARLSDVEQVTEHSSTLGRQLGYGTVVIQGRGGTGATLRHVRNPDGLCRAMIERAKASAHRRA